MAVAVSINRTATTSFRSCSAISSLGCRRQCLITSCSSNLSSLSSCCGCWVDCVSGDARKRAAVKSVPKVSIHSDLGNKERISSTVNISSSRLRFKSIFGKRASWRRIFFASKKLRGIMLLNVSTVIFASNVPVVKEVEAIIDPGVFSVVRFALAAIPFIPIVLHNRDDPYPRQAGIELGFWASLGYILQAVGLLTSDAGRASFLSMLTVIVVPLIDGMLGSSVPAHTWFGALMCVTGVGMLESSGSPPCVGDLLNLFSAISFGIHMLRTEHISRRTRKEDILPLIGYEVLIVALVSTIWYFIEGWFRGGIQELNLATWTWEEVIDWISVFPWVPALYTGSFSTGLCLWVEMVAMYDVSATETAIIYGLEPVWGAGFAWFLLGERWGALGWVGAALVLGGSLSVQLMGAASNSLSGEHKNRDAGTNNLPMSDKQK